ncbi:MAG: hypothetical protein HUJ68_02485 [Clostridia bacterium]|nr:hypothetical protein [Clostridia bacterium]
MHEIFNELLKKYPQLKSVMEKEAKRKRKSLTDYINSRNAIELAVINAECFKKIINKKFNFLDENIAKNYKKYTEYAVEKIH